MASPPPAPPSAVAAEHAPLHIDALQHQLQASTGRDVRRIETHISWVLLDGEHAWKIKKPVRLGFLDFGELALRRQACEDELRLNRRLAPALYLDVVPIRGSAAAPRIGGSDGAVIDYALRMKQFAAGALLSERMAAGTLDPDAIDRLAARLAAFHQQACAAGAETAYGTPESVLGATAGALAELASRTDDKRLGDMMAWCRAEGERLQPAFAARKRDGWVREGHGDLHLANLVALGDDVTAFDCIEFDPALRWIDVQSDIAFLTMDLQAHGRRDLAFRFLDRWLEVTGDVPGLAVHRYYAVYRALVRAMVAAIRRSEGLEAGGPDYLAVAGALAGTRDPRLLVTHGLSGSGKSFVAQRLLEAAGAIRLRSDVERKRLFGLRALDATTALGDAVAYSPETTRRTYARLREAAAAALDAGYPVIVDAAFLKSGERAEFRRLARSMGVPFSILDCHADPGVLRARIRARRARADDASEADLAVLDRQFAGNEPLEPGERATCIDVDTTRPPAIGAIAARWLAMQ